MAVQVGTEGNDFFSSYMTVDTVDGLGGTDTWDGDYLESAEDLTFTYDASTASGSLSNGTLLTSIERGSILTGEGNDTIILTGNAEFEVNGFRGFDTLVRDDSGTTSRATSYTIFLTDPRFGQGYWDGTLAGSAFRFIEAVDVTMSDDDNAAFIELGFLPLDAGRVTLDGGLGTDRLTLDAINIADATFIVGPGGAVTSNLGSFAGFESYDLTFGSGNLQVTTGAGADVIRPHPAGISTVDAGPGDDTILAGGELTLDGGAGVDTLQVMGVRSGFTLVGNAADSFVLTDTDPDDGTEGTAVLLNMEFIQFADELVDLSLLSQPGLDLTGTARADTLKGGDGNDTLLGLGGFDTLRGFAGNDMLEGGAGHDFLAGGTGDDILRGGAGGDWLRGGQGADLLEGSEGKDWLYGGRGADVLSGGPGADELFGGEGADRFRFDILEPAGKRDVIHDFEQGIDRIELFREAFSALAAGPAGALDPRHFHLGTSAAGADDHLIYHRASGSLFYDPDGAGGQEQVRIAVLIGNPALEAADFLLA